MMGVCPAGGTFNGAYTVGLLLVQLCVGTIYPSSSKMLRIEWTVEVDFIPVAAHISLTVGGKPPAISFIR